MTTRFDWSRVVFLGDASVPGSAWAPDSARAFVHRVETIAACTARPVHCPPDAPACPSCLERVGAPKEAS